VLGFFPGILPGFVFLLGKIQEYHGNFRKKIF
jgi:hypothetical protein